MHQISRLEGFVAEDAGTIVVANWLSCHPAPILGKGDIIPYALLAAAAPSFRLAHQGNRREVRRVTSSKILSYPSQAALSDFYACSALPRVSRLPASLS